MPRILLVEDDEAVAETLALALRGLGHHVLTAASGEDALNSLLTRQAPVDVILLDIMLPGIDGFEVCRQVRTRSAVPIVLLTARSDPVDVVVGLECGADDYVVKPAEPRVLDARTKAILRRATPAAPSKNTRLRLGDLEIDTLAMSVTRNNNDVELTATELRLLLTFAEHLGHALSRRVLLKLVWDYGYTGDSRIVDAAVARLRAKIEPDPHHPALLRTVRGIGYRMTRP